MINTKNDLSFTGFWANLKMSNTLNNAVSGRVPHCLYSNHEPLSTEINRTRLITRAFDTFAKSKPNN